jgi:hypothetical protein
MFWTALCGMLCTPAWADFKLVKTHGGVKVPVNGPAGTQITLITTGRAKNGQAPPEIKTHEQIINKGPLTFTVPESEEDSTGTKQTVVDYKLQVTPPGAAKLQFSLDVESFAPSGADFLQNSVSDELFETVGDGVEIRIPDFSAGNGATLFAAVNLDDFIPANFDFKIGDVVSIVNGSSPDLPGMIFGNTDFLMDPNSANGFGNSSPFTGTVTVVGQNDPSSFPVPEPGSGCLLVGGFFLLYLHRRSRATIDT